MSKRNHKKIKNYEQRKYTPGEGLQVKAKKTKLEKQIGEASPEELVRFMCRIKNLGGVK